MKNARKVISVLLAILMVVTAMPLTALTAFAEDTVYTDGDWQYTLDSDNAVITGYLGSNTDISVPDEVGVYTVTEIGANAFWNSSIVTVSFPDTLQYIDEYAFKGCADLNEVTLPSGIRGIGQYAFYDCTSLYEIMIPNKTVNLMDYCLGFVYDGEGDSIGDLTMRIPAESTGYDYCDYFNISYEIMEMFEYIDFIDIYNGDTNSVMFTEDDNTAYFRFVPEQDGTYVFESLYDGDQTDPCALLYDSDGYLLTSDDNGANDAYDNFRFEYTLSQGSEYFLCCSQNGLGAFGYDFKVSKYSAAASYPVIELDTLTTAVIPNGESVAYFQFTPTVSGTYCFESFADADTFGYIYDDSQSYTLADDDDSGDNNNFKIQYDLDAGTTYILGARFYSYASGSFDVKLYKAPAATSIEFAEGNAISGFVGSVRTLNLNFLPEGASVEFIDFVCADESVARVTDSDNTYCTVEFIGEGTTTLYARNIGETLVAECTITVTGIPVIQEDTLTSAVIANGGDYAYFKFTPSESGTYYFESYANTDTFGYLYDSGLNEITSDDESGTGNNFKIQYDLDAGTTYIFGARYYNSGYTGNFNVKVYKAPAATSVYFTNGSSYSGFIYDRIDLYTEYLPEGSISESCNFLSSNSSVADIGYTSDNYCEVNLVGVGTATITATSTNGLEAVYTITCLAPTVLTLDTPTSFDMSDGSAVCASFTPEESGIYMFAVTDATNGDSFYKDLYLDGSLLAGWSDAKYVYESALENGNTYLVKVPAGNYDGSFKLTVSKCVAATGVVFETEAGFSDYINTSTELVATLSPDNAIPEEITFASSDDSIVSITYNGYYSASRYYCGIILNSVGTATITATSESGKSATYTVTVIPYPALTLDTPLTFNLESGKSGAAASFTPTESGTYAFTCSDYSNGYYFYKYLELDGATLTTTYGTAITANLTAGNTYYFKTASYYGAFKVTVTKLVEATGVEFVTEPGLSGGQYSCVQLAAKLVPDNAINQNITFTTGNPDIAVITSQYIDDETGNYICELNLKAAGTVTITATSESSLTATYDVTVNALPTITLDTPYRMISAGYDEYSVVAFNCTETGTYRFTSSKYCEKNIYEGFNYETYTGENSLTLELTAGKTYLFKCRYFNGFNDLTLIKCVAANSLTFEKSSYSGEEYTLLNISALLGPSNAIPEGVTFTSSDSSVAAINGYGSLDLNASCELKLLSAGTATITARSSDNLLTATCTVTVRALPSLTLNSPYTLNSSDDNEMHYVKFRPTLSSGYYFNTGDYGYITVNEGFDYYTEGNGSVYAELTAGTTYVIGVNEFVGQNTITVKRAVNATSMTLSESSINGYAYTTVFLNTALAPANAIPQAASFSSSDNNIVEVYDYGDNYCELRLLAPGTATITATSTSGLTATCEITVSAMPTLTLDTPYAVYNEDDNDYCYAAFTPSEDGGYYFKTTGNSFNEVYIGFDSYASQYGSIYCDMKSGTTFIIRMSEFTGSNSVTVTKASPATALNITDDAVSGYAYTYKHLTVEFAPDNCIPEDVEFTSSDTSVVRINNIYTSQGKKRCALELVSAGTATITATSENGLTDTCTVTVITPLVLTQNTLTPVEIVENKEVCFSFTPSEGGTYFFKLSDYSNKNSACITLQEGFNQLYYSDSDVFSYDLTAGETYILKTNYYNWYTSTGGSGTYNLLAVKAVPATGISLSQDTLTGYVGTSAYLEVSFDPWNAEAEGYTFSSSDDSIVSVDNYGQVTFVGAGTATITVTSDSGFTDTCSVTSRNMKVLTLGVTATAEIGNGIDRDYFTFTAPESGYYVFYSSADNDTYAEIFDSNFNYLDDDDDSGVNNNFRIKREMTAGETYIFSARFYGSDTSGNFPVIIEKKAVATGVDIVTMPTKTEYIKGYLNQSFDASGLVIRIHWSDSTVTNYSYSASDRYVDGLPVQVSAFTVGDGNSARFRVSYDGINAYGNLTLIDSPVESIELVYNDCLTLVENTNGYQSSRWNYLTDSSEEYFHYNINSTRDIAVRINYKDGTSKVAYVGDNIDGINVTYTDTQDDQPWTVGASNSFRINYIDKSVSVPVIVISNGVDSIEIVTPTASSFIENSDGNEDEYWDDVNMTYVPFFRYNIWSEDLTDAVIRINYLDGTSTTAHIGDTVNGYPVSFRDTQYGIPWSLGTNYLTVTYMGETAQMPVSVVETPVDSITVNSAPTYTYIYGDSSTGYMFEDEGISCYALNSFNLQGLSFTVNFKNGTQKTYTYQDIDQNGRIDGHSLRQTDVDYGNGMDGATQPGNVTVNWSYMGTKFGYNAVISENTVSSIEILEQPTVSSHKDSFYMDPYGLKVRIHYSDSTYTDVTFTQSNTELNYEDMMLGGRFCHTVTVNNYDLRFYKFWDGEYAYYKVEYIGKSATLNGHMSDVGIADVSIVTFADDFDGMVLDVCYDDGTDETLTLSKIAKIAEFADGADYLVNSSSGMFFGFIAPIRDGNNQITSYWVEALMPTEYYLNVSFIDGDIDSDGDVDLSDYEIIKAYISGDSITSSKLDSADINGDGAVDAFDLFELDKIINGTLASKFTYSEINASAAKIASYTGTDTDLTLPKYYGSHVITTIAQNAFKAKNTLVSVEFCDSITTLENYAFQNCNSLKNIQFNDGLDKINYGSFLNCTKLERVVLPNSVTTIGSNAFKGCTSLKYVAISSGVTSLSGSNIFANCTSLETVIIPESVTAINANTFAGCGPQLTIYGKSGSYAETFANANGITFVAINAKI